MRKQGFAGTDVANKSAAYDYIEQCFYRGDFKKDPKSISRWAGTVVVAQGLPVINNLTEDKVKSYIYDLKRTANQTTEITDWPLNVHDLAHWFVDGPLATAMHIQ